MGSAAHMRSASTCSVTTIEPISAAMPAPTRVASMSAPIDAARSRTRSCMYVAPRSVRSRHDALRLQARLQHEDHADEAHHDGHEEERLVADLVHLLGDGAGLAPAVDAVVERADEHRVELAADARELDRARADGGDARVLDVLRDVRLARRAVVRRGAQSRLNETK